MTQDFHLFPMPQGLMLAIVVIAKRRPDGTFEVEGRERKIHALLQAAHGRPVPLHVIAYIKRGCELLTDISDEALLNAAYPFFPAPYARCTRGDAFCVMTKALMLFALTGLNDMAEPVAGKARMMKMRQTSRRDALLKAWKLPTWDDLAKDDGDDSGDDEDSEDDSSDAIADDDGGDSSDGGNSHYNPDEPRIPAGQPGAGQWTTGDNTSSNTENAQGNNSTDYQGLPDKPIEPIYPIEETLVFIFGGEVLAIAREALGLTEGAVSVSAVGNEAVIEGSTEHGVLRASERAISDQEAQDAIESAKDTGNVTTQIGKYGTPQNVYQGANGVTVVVETAGRNANKIITLYRK